MTVAAGDALPFPVYAGRYRVVFPLLDADGDLVTGATTPDCELSQDQGTFADATNEMTEIATGSGVYYLDLIGTETDCSCLAIIAKSATAGMKTTVLTLYPRRYPVLRSGTAQAGAAGTITLDSGASAVDDFYNGCLIQCSNNSPANVQGQTRFITDYVGSTKVATVGANWGTNPSSATTFEIYVPETAGVGAYAGAEPSVTTAGLPNANVNSIANNAITAASIATGAIDADAIADNAIDAGAIAADAITAAKIADGAIDANTFAAGAINAAAIAADAIGASELAADAVAEIADAIWDEAASGHTTAGTYGQALNIIRANTAQAGASTTITLDASASAVDDFYNNMIIFITGGTGVGQSRIISDYVGSTKVATVSAWATNPDATSVFVILPFGAIPGASAPTAAEVADAVWDEDATAHQTQGTFGQAIGDPVADADTIWALVNTNLNATVSSRASQTSVDTVDDFLDTEVAAIKAVTDALPDAGALTTIQSDLDNIQTRLPAALVGGRMDSDATAISGDTTAADNLESEYDGTGYGHVLQRTTIATLASQTSFTLTAGSADNDAYNGCIIVIQDATTAAQKAVGVILDYTGATRTITLLNDPTIFTMAATDIVTIIADRALKPAVDNRTVGIAADGDVLEVNTLTGHTAQTGDNFARLGAPAGASVSADILAIDNFVDDLESRLGTPTNLGSGATIAANLVDIEGQTDDIGAAGAGLTAVPWNSAWDAEVQSEVQDALEVNNLDHLVKIAVDTDFPTTVHLNSVVGHLADNGTAASFDRTTDSLEALQAEHDATQTAVDNVDNFIDTEVAAIKAVTDAIGATGTGLSAIPWNAAWDAEVQSEATDALNAYDPPTNAEMEARTLIAANYATASALDAVDNFVDTEIADIQARLPAALTAGGNMKSDAMAVNGSTSAAAQLARSAATIVNGAAIAGTLSTTQMTTDLTEATDDHFNGRIIIWTSGVLINQATDITDYTGATKLLTFTAVTEAPSAADTFIII